MTMADLPRILISIICRLGHAQFDNEASWPSLLYHHSTVEIKSNYLCYCSDYELFSRELFVGLRTGHFLLQGQWSHQKLKLHNLDIRDNLDIHVSMFHWNSWSKSSTSLSATSVFLWLRYGWQFLMVSLFSLCLLCGIFISITETRGVKLDIRSFILW